MKTNVGGKDRQVRSWLGPALMAASYLLGGRRGKLGGLLGMVGGALVTESAITRTCPMNRLLGINTARRRWRWF